MLILESISLLISLFSVRLMAHLALQVVQGLIALLELLVELLLRVGNFISVILAFTSSSEATTLSLAALCCRISSSIIFAENGEAGNVDLLRRRILRGLSLADLDDLILAFQLGALNILAVHGGHHVRRGER
jgi:hypothetical protein